MNHYDDDFEYTYPKTYVLDKTKIKTVEDVVEILMHGQEIVVYASDISGHPLEQYLKPFGG